MEIACSANALGVVVVILFNVVGVVWRAEQLQVISEDSFQQGVVVENFQLGH